MRGAYLIAGGDFIPGEQVVMNGLINKGRADGDRLAPRCPSRPMESVVNFQCVYIIIVIAR